MPVSITPPAESSVDDTLIDSIERVTSAVARGHCHALSDILETPSDTSSDDTHHGALIQRRPSAEAILQLIRDSAHQLLDLTGGRSELPHNVAGGPVDEEMHLQNMSKVSDDIVRNLGRILELRSDSTDHEMKDTVTVLSPVTTPTDNISSPGLLRTRRPPLRQRGSRLVCRSCHCIATPKWRPGPHGPATLCNVCGLVYAKRMGIIEGLHDG